MRNNAVEFVNSVMGHGFVECQRASGSNMKLEDLLQGAIRRKHFSLRTEESYVGCYRRYVLWHGKRHPAEMGVAEVEAFLTHLAGISRR
jgi:hypothetical protein